MVGKARVVGGEHKQRVLIPRLAAGGGKEGAQGVVAVAHTAVERIFALLRIPLLLTFGHFVGGMGRGGEQRRHERLAKVAHLLGVKLKERLVPNRPSTVEISIAAETLVGVELRAAIVLPETGGFGKGLKTHRAVGRPVEEGGVIALRTQFASQSAQMVERSGREEKGFDKHGDGRQHRGHTVNAFASVAEGVFKGQALLHQ